MINNSLGHFCSAFFLFLRFTCFCSTFILVFFFSLCCPFTVHRLRASEMARERVGECARVRGREDIQREKERERRHMEKLGSCDNNNKK